jgi:hypothetical protein
MKRSDRAQLGARGLVTKMKSPGVQLSKVKSQALLATSDSSECSIDGHG